MIESAPDGCPLILTFDGKGIVMVPEALRPATAKAAASAENKLATRLSPGEKNGRKRMAELACVYDAVPVPRTPEDVISTPAQNRRKSKAQAAELKGKTKPREPQARGKWLTASVTDDIPAVIAEAFAEADRRDPGHAADGSSSSTATTPRSTRSAPSSQALRDGDGPDRLHPRDGIPVEGRLVLLPQGDPEAEEWVEAQAPKILNGKAREVWAGIRRRATPYGYCPERAGADACASYLENKKDYLDYAALLKDGWPVATGMIEGACRHIVKDSMEVTGARWGLDGAEAVLKLRALIATGDFEDYWRFHLRREHNASTTRNTARPTSSQRDQLTPNVAPPAGPNHPTF